MLSSGLATGLLKVSAANSAALGVGSVMDAHHHHASPSAVDQDVDRAFNVNEAERNALFDEAKATIIKARSELLRGGAEPEVAQGAAGVAAAAAPAAVPWPTQSDETDHPGVQESSSSAASASAFVDALGLSEAVNTVRTFTQRFFVCDFGREKCIRRCDPGWPGASASQETRQ
eukprot:TRINITY_DN64398_c0_g1_i1.p1 TRINITY_DN64398_c0_g1~~TRINITY_DN64398_c0_g1_i1.p1  ORF type:complete len:174 (-),score=38.35 TRINITY_DN64398_c0_g1_i1:90-611(-)